MFLLLALIVPIVQINGQYNDDKYGYGDGTTSTSGSDYDYGQDYYQDYGQDYGQDNGDYDLDYDQFYDEDGKKYEWDCYRVQGNTYFGSDYYSMTKVSSRSQCERKCGENPRNIEPTDFKCKGYTYDKSSIYHFCALYDENGIVEGDRLSRGEEPTDPTRSYKCYSRYGPALAKTRFSSSASAGTSRLNTRVGIGRLERDCSDSYLCKARSGQCCFLQKDFRGIWYLCYHNHRLLR